MLYGLEGRAGEDHGGKGVDGSCVLEPRQLEARDVAKDAIQRQLDLGLADRRHTASTQCERLDFRSNCSVGWFQHVKGT